MSLRLSIIKKMADIEGTDSTLRHRLLKKSIVLFYRLYGSLPRPIRILDVGGTHYFWQAVGLSDVQDVEITILNKETVDVGDSTAGFRNVVGDARWHESSGRLAEAETWYKKAVEFSSTSYVLCAELADLYGNRYRKEHLPSLKDSAVYYYERALYFAPEDQEIYRNMRKILGS